MSIRDVLPGMPNSPLSKCTEYEIHVAMMAMVKELVARHEHNCITCCEFDKDRDICKLANAKPPATIIVKGCELWDDIPF